MDGIIYASEFGVLNNILHENALVSKESIVEQQDNFQRESSLRWISGRGFLDCSSDKPLVARLLL
jgi:hypothetical protein